MYYLSPLSISLASEDTLNARIELRRPKLALCDDVNLEDSVTPPETEMGIIFCTCTSGKLRYSLLTIVIEAVQCGPSSGGTQSVDIRLKVPPQCKLLLFQTLKFKVNKSLSCTRLTTLYMTYRSYLRNPRAVTTPLHGRFFSP